MIASIVLGLAVLAFIVAGGYLIRRAIRSGNRLFYTADPADLGNLIISILGVLGIGFMIYQIIKGMGRLAFHAFF